jgi:hypothetical protein
MAPMHVVAMNHWVGLTLASSSVAMCLCMCTMNDVHKVCIFREDEEPIFDVHASGTWECFIIVHTRLFWPHARPMQLYSLAKALFVAIRLPISKQPFYLCPASLRSCTSVRALLPLMYATMLTTPATGSVWNRVQL